MANTGGGAMSEPLPRTDKALWWGAEGTEKIKPRDVVTIRNGLECVILERVHPTEPCRVCIALNGSSGQFGYLRTADLPLKIKGQP